MIIVFAPFTVIVFGNAKALALRLRNDWVRSKTASVGRNEGAPASVFILGYLLGMRRG